MGCLFSCSSSSSNSPPKHPDFVRVVHLSGFVVDFAPPVTVSDITGATAAKQHHFLCSSAELLCVGPTRLCREGPLVPGRVYFLLPCYLLDSPDSSSPASLASLAKRLTAAAKRAGRAGPLAGPEAVGPPSRSSWKPVLETIAELSRRMEALSFRSLGDGDSYECLLHYHDHEPVPVASYHYHAYV